MIPLAAADYEALDFFVPQPECGEPVQECLDRCEPALPPCVDGSELARTFFTYAALVGAPMCSAFECGSHDRWP
jgi:hypothetical protein